MPRKAVRVAKVMMKGGSPSLLIPKAWKAPIAKPMSKRNKDGNPNWETAGQQHGNDHAGKADHCAHRQIDAGRDDDKRLADREDSRHGTLPEQVLNVVGGGEILGAKGQQNPHQSQQGDQG